MQPPLLCWFSFHLSWSQLLCSVRFLLKSSQFLHTYFVSLDNICISELIESEKNQWALLNRLCSTKLGQVFSQLCTRQVNSSQVTWLFIEQKRALCFVYNKIGTFIVTLEVETLKNGLTLNVQNLWTKDWNFHRSEKL